MNATSAAKKISVTAKSLALVRDERHYPALMAGDGEPVILMHGFPDCYLNWQGQVEALAEAGFCAVAPALRGYAPGCLAANGDYSLRAAAEDICATAEQFGGSVHLVGHDWGAAAGYLACAKSPSLFRSYTALSIPPIRRLPGALLRVPEQLLLSAYMEFFQLPVVAEWWLRRDHYAGVETLWRRWSPDWEPGHFLDQARETLAQPGVLSAALGWYRHLPRVWTDAGRETLGLLRKDVLVPTLVLFGKKDGCMSERLLEHCVQPMDFPAGIEVESVAGAGHFLHLERPERVNNLLINHLRKH